jgi:hypothetical protein
VGCMRLSAEQTFKQGGKLTRSPSDVWRLTGVAEVVLWMGFVTVEMLRAQWWHRSGWSRWILEYMLESSATLHHKG